MTPVLDIIVVNWNAGKQLGVCMRSILAADRPAFRFGRVVVVDNGSTDGSADGIEALGQAGWRLVTERYSLQLTAPKLLALLRQAAVSKHRAATHA